MEAQVESAIDLALNPHTELNLKAQAIDFLGQLRDDPGSWQLCLALFTRHASSSEVVRVVCLEIVNNAVQTQRLAVDNLNEIRHRLMDYVRRRCAPESTGSDSSSIQNKLTQTLTYLFTALYASDWPNFFDEFITLPGSSGTIMFLRVLSSIHDEIADVMIPRTQDEQRRSNELKDLIRERDVVKIAGTWQELLSHWRMLDLTAVEMCLRTIAKWANWIDISLVINGVIQNALLEIAGQQGMFASESLESKARNAAIDTFTETVGKKMPPNDKVDLINYLNLSTIVGQLVASPALAELRKTAKYDTDLAETVAKLVNNVVFDIVKVLDTDKIEDQTRSKADQLLQSFVPYLLRFFSDEYDEICAAVIPSLTDLLTMFRRLVVRSKNTLPERYAPMLQPILDAIIAKMKFDETASWGDEDEQTDEAEFQELRKRLHVLQQTVAAVDQQLYMSTLSNVVANTLGRLESNDQPNWRDIDLALLEMHHFGELAIKNSGLYTKTVPSNEAARILVQMMTTLVNSNLASHPHAAVQLQFMELCVRYVQFFEQNVEAIPKALNSFVSFVHSDHDKVRLRSWYLFQKFVYHLRAQLANYAQTVVQAIADLLPIKAELPSDKDDDDLSSEDNGQSADALFQSQLYLFQAIGNVTSVQTVPVQTKVAVAKSVIDPLSLDLNQHLPLARNGDERAIQQTHHIVMALGTLADGFADFTLGNTKGARPPAEVSQEFMPASECILTALESLKQHSELRAAARHAFSRFMDVLGSHMLPQLPRWIEGLLSSASSNDEMAMFLRSLGQVVHGFKAEIYNILDQLITPLFQRVFSGLSQPVTGTDDEIQLRELKQQYLSFITTIISNDLGAVLVSPSNQRIFETVISSIAGFSCDASDPQSARMAFTVLKQMTSVWGGPDISINDGSTSQPALPGFDTFICATFAPLPWNLISAQKFNAQDAQMRSVLQEAASLQWVILRKIGLAYQQQLSNELRNLGVADDGVQSFIGSIGGDLTAFKKFFATFVQQAKG